MNPGHTPHSVPHGRLALGTVQFGLEYGVANSTGKVSEAEVARILSRASSAGLDTLDTAVAYGNSEAALGHAGVSRWRVITKLPGLPAGIIDVAAWVHDQARASLARLKVARVDALLLHRPADLLGPQGGAYLAALRELESSGLAGDTGVSIYDPTELDALWPVWQPRVVQAPMNVLDRRLINSGWLARLADHGVRVHVRSVFLQGLLLMPAASRPAYFSPWAPLLDRWLAWCDSARTAPRDAALAFVASHRAVERLVVGVDTSEQLEALLESRFSEIPVPGPELQSEDRGLIEPSRWKLS